jgi:hypothetical protein
MSGLFFGGSKVLTEHLSKIFIYHESTKTGKHENAPSFFLGSEWSGYRDMESIICNIKGS